MFLDGREIPRGTVLDADLAIIGAGAAGITIARELAGSRLSVLLIESGGYDYDRDNNDLYSGDVVGLPYADLASTRLRYFGGSTNHWGGWCRPLSPIDFEARDWVPHSGWPFGRSHLDPFYRRAQDIVEAGPFAYDDEERWAAATGGKLALPESDIHVGFFQYSPPTRFGQRYRGDIARAENVRSLLNTNVLELETEPSGRYVTGLALATLDGKRFGIRAARYVLAAGGIENPRLLLLSNRAKPAGLGNDHDLVGRFFMDHPHLAPARLVVTPGEAAHLAIMDEFYTDQAHIRHCLMPSEDFLRRVKGVNIVSTLGEGTPVNAERAAADSNGEPDYLLQGVASLARGLDPGPVGGDTRLAGAYETIVGLAAEPFPNPDSRVLLGEEADRFGQRKVRLDWRLTSEDVPALRRTLQFFAVAFGKTGLGRLQYRHDGSGEWPGFIGWGNHHMGTTRMAADPTLGVVNVQGQVHGVENLYVAGSSVFPTAGAANPTLTVVALALRLADHLLESSP